MSLPETIFLSDLFRHRARCDKGIDHGPGAFVWMHPPVHRILGWATRPSSFNSERHVWRLNQICAISDQQVYVKGIPSVSNVFTLDLLPSLLDAHLLNNNGHKLGLIVDFVFNSKTGKILYYLISRSDPRLPGSSRWRLSLDRIVDQHPGRVEVNARVLDELPLSRSSIKQDLLRQTRNFREQFNQFTSLASDKLEGWLDESLSEEKNDLYPSSNYKEDFDSILDWDDNNSDYLGKDRNDNISDGSYKREKYSNIESNEEDPWV